MLDEPIGPLRLSGDQYVRSREMLDVLLDAGADINGRSRWWAGGFGILDVRVPTWPRMPSSAAHAWTPMRRRGWACLTRCANCSRRIPRSFMRAAATVRRRCTWHTAWRAAAILLDAGADINARDVDHESTPAQYMAGDRLDVARHLVARGCQTDLLLAAALGDVALSRQHLDANPAHPDARERRLVSDAGTRKPAGRSISGRSISTRPRTRLRTIEGIGICGSC